MGLISMGLTYYKEQREAAKLQKSREEYLKEAKTKITCSDSELGITIDSNGELTSTTISKDFSELAYFSNNYSKYLSIDSSFAEPLAKADQKLSGLKQKAEMYQNRYASQMATMPKFADIRAKFKEANAKKYEVSPMQYALSIFGIGGTAANIRKEKLEAEKNFIKDAFKHKTEIDSILSEFRNEKKEVVKKVNENLNNYHSTMGKKLTIAREYIAIKDLLDNQTVKTALMTYDKDLAIKIKNFPYPLVISDNTTPLPELPSLAEIKTALNSINKPDSVQELDNRINKINDGLSGYKRTTTREGIEYAQRHGKEMREKEKADSPEVIAEKLKAANKKLLDAEKRRSQIIEDNREDFDELQELQKERKKKDKNGNSIRLSQKKLLRLYTLQKKTRELLSDVNREINRAQALVDNLTPFTKEDDDKEPDNNSGKEYDDN